MLPIGIIGLGDLGTTLSRRIRASGLAIKSFDTNPSVAHTEVAPESAIRGTSFVFLCIPTSATEIVLQDFGGTDAGIAISFSKGLSSDGKTVAEMFLERLGAEGRWAVSGGPMLASEIASGRSSFSAIGATSEAVWRDVSGLFSQIGLYSVASDDPLGISMLGVLKNVYTIGIGIAQGLNLGNNFYGAMGATSMVEIQRVLKVLGYEVDSDLASELAGIGDLIATSSSGTSHHRSIGIQIVQTGRIKTGEGTESARLLGDRLRNSLSELPILDCIRNIVTGKIAPQEIEKAVLSHFV